MADQPLWKPLIQRMNVKFEKVLPKMHNIWENMGCSKETQMMYYEQAGNHLEDLVDDMVDELQSKEEMLFKSINHLLEKMAKLNAELHLDNVSKNYEKVPLMEVEQMLQAEVQNLERTKKDRMMLLTELLNKEHNICKKLGIKKLSITTDVVLTEEELQSFNLYVEKQENEKIHLENIFMAIRNSIIKIMNDLDVTPSSSFEQLICNNPEEFVLSANNMAKSEELRDKLKTQMEERKSCIEKMKEDLLVLWKYLDEPADIYQSFLDRYPGYSADTINAFTTEIKRLKEKRKENIFKYVNEIRLELMKLWDLCKYCEAERNTFAPFHSNTFTEDLLTLHELEVDRLRKFYNDNRTIFDLLEQRENLVMKVKELLQRANNPDRYHNRGGQLLIEEKERKVIQKKLPKIEAELKQLINDYEIKHNQMFTIYGTSLENVLTESWENINLEKETIKRVRKEAKDKSIKKSPLSSSKRTPGMSHLSIARNPMLGLSKRKLFTPSPNSSAKKRNKNSDKNRPTVTASKIRRSNRLTKTGQKAKRSSRSGKKKELSSSNSSITDTTYNQFQGHMTDREELHSSMLPERILKNSNKLNVNKTPIVRTPMKPLRKNLSATATPVNHNSARKPLHSPRTVNTPKLATATSNLPFIF